MCQIYRQMDLILKMQESGLTMFLMIICLICINFSFISGEPLVDSTENSTAYAIVSTTNGEAIPASPVQILGKLPLRMIQGKTRPVVYGFANFLSGFYSLEISSTDTDVVRIVESDGIRLISPSMEENYLSPNNTNDNNDSLAFAMTIANFTLKGIRFGKAHLILGLRNIETGEIDEELSELLPSALVAVIRMPTAFDMSFGYALLVFSALTTGIMGCEIEWDRLKVIFKKPYGIIIGICCQFFIMPLTAFVLCIIFQIPNDLSIGVLLAACSPGGGMSNMTTVVIEGHLLLSIAMTFISTCLALGMMPLNLFIYSRRFVDDTTFPIPFDKLIIGLVCLLVPLSLGFLLRRCKPNVAMKVLRVLRPACLVVVLFTMAGGMYTIRFVFTYIIPNMIICSILLPIVGFILGATVAILLRRPIREVKTISIETGIQNVAIAAGVIRLTYPYPDADMVSSTVMWTMLGQFFAVTVMMVTYTIYKRFCKKYKSAVDYNSVEENTVPKVAQNGKPNIVQLGASPDSNFQNIHAHLARITNPTSDYEQLPQTASKPKTDKHDRFGGYSRLTSSTSTTTADEAMEMEALPEFDGRDQSGNDALWEPRGQS